MKFITLFILLLTSTVCLAAPDLVICFDGNCETRLNIKLTDNAWSEVENILSDKIISDKQERQCIAKAFAVIEKDAFKTLSKITNNELSPQQVHARMNNRDEASNSKTFISLLMDNHLSSRYYLRKTEKPSQQEGIHGSITNPS